MSKFIVYNLRETYHELGEYEFKIVLDPAHFKNSQTCEVAIVDSDRRPLTFKVNKWGRKINVKFTIDGSVADGVASIDLIEMDKGETSRMNCWIIKP